MAVHVIVSIFDRVAGFYQTPAYVQSKGTAVRSFTSEINRPDDKNMLYQHYKDFDLYYLGLWDDNNGLHSLHEPPELILQGSAARTEVQSPS